MNFDELLDFLFHKWIGILISFASIVVVMLSFSGCLLLDFCACWNYGCGAGNAAYFWDSASQECDYECFYCFGGSYDYYDDSYSGSSCNLNECLFGRYGCQKECGNCAIDCGGVNASLLVGLCEDMGCVMDGQGMECDGCLILNCNNAEGWGCYTSDYDTKRMSCANCTVFCNGPDDPDSPNYSPDYLYSIKIIDYYGNEKKFGIYSNTTSIPYDTIKGMNFVGYFSQPDGQGTRFYDGVLPSENMTVYAFYEDAFKDVEFTVEVYARYQINMNSDQYSAPELIHTFMAMSGDIITPWLPSVHTGREGYEFSKWSCNIGNENVTIGNENGLFASYDPFAPAEFGMIQNSGEMILSIYADYDLITHSVKINFPVTSGVKYKTITVLDKTLISSIVDKSPDTQDNSIFAGYSLYENSDLLLAEDYEITSDMTLYAVYKEAITVKFKDNEESSNFYSKIYYEGEIVELPVPQDVPVGKEFDYWTLSNDFSKRLTTVTIDKSYQEATLIAVYKNAKYTISFYDGEDYLSSITYYMGDDTVFAPLEKDYCDFVGWFKNPNLTGSKYESISPTDASDYSLYAKFTPKKYIIELNGMGATNLSDYDVEVSYGEYFKLPIPQRTGYTFAGWYYNDGLSNKQLTDEHGKSLDVFSKYNGYEYPNKNDIGIMVFAVWHANTYTVTFSGEGMDIVTKTCEHGHAISATTDPTKPGYTFAGWYNGDTLYDFSSKVYSDITLTARFTPIEYTITLVLLNGSFENSGSSEITIKYVYGSGMIELCDVPQRDGFLFTGWYKNPNATGNVCIRSNGSTTSYLDAYVITPGLLEYTLYAGWITDNN